MNHVRQDEVLEILAPLSGVLVSLDEVPDQTFAGRLVGDGISIDPVSGTLLAPVDGTVIQLNVARHAVIIRTAQSIDVMVHIGLDTVNLQGDGFEACCAVGDRVCAGDVLIRFDLDQVACRALSLLTQIVVMNDVDVTPIPGPARRLISAGQPILQVAVTRHEADPEAGTEQVHASGEVCVPNPCGMHARPAAVAAACARGFASDLRLCRPGEASGANMKSASALMQMGLVQGDAVRIDASGTDAAHAVSRLAALIEAGCGDDLAQATSPPPALRAVAGGEGSGHSGAVSPAHLRGQIASPGRIIGRITHMRVHHREIAEQGGTPEVERRQLRQALAGAAEALQVEGRHNATAAEIFAAHRELLADPDLLQATDKLIESGKSAAFSWYQVCGATARTLSALDNPLLSSRAHDLDDLAERVVRLLQGTSDVMPTFAPDSILVADNLSPSQAIALADSPLAGICLAQGGATSHVAILARAQGLPMICGAGPAVHKLAEGQEALLDADAGILRLAPDAAQRQAVELDLARRCAREQEALRHAAAPAVTRDGHRIEIAANVASLDDVLRAVKAGADGVGLLRTECLYLDRDLAPTEDEQAAVYTRMAAALGAEQALVIRTLDVGGDKPLPYLNLPHEDNPFLGLRGIRLCLAQPDLLREQLRAILRAGGPEHARLHVMFPMVTSIDELRAARQMLEQERQRLALPTPVSVGIMIEVPAAALMADVLAAEVDFFSIGTNDLSQYVLAMDRGHPELSAQIDALHPAVLRMIEMTVKAAHARGKWVGLCGNLAAEPVALPLLLGLGLDELSVGGPAVPQLKQQLRTLHAGACRDLAVRALQATSAQEVRALLREHE